MEDKMSRSHKRDQLEQSPRRSFANDGKPGRPTRPTKGTEKAKPSPSSGSGDVVSRRIASSSRPVAKRPTSSTPRVAPAARAANRQAKNVSRPLPQPPARRPIAARTAATAAAVTAVVSEEVKADISRIQSEFERVEREAQLGSVYDDIGKFDAKLVEYPLEVDGLRGRGYVHSGQIEDQIEALDDRWDEVRPRVEQALKEKVQNLDRELDETERKVDRMRDGGTARMAETAVNSLANQIKAAVSTVEGLYQSMENELDQLGYRINQMSTMLKCFEGSPQIRLYEAEGPLLSVESEWQQNGDEGPGGFLFLTDQRLMFEQREEVVTKRKFGFFKSESEKLQKLLIEVQTSEIQEISHKEEGGFLGMGKADILELVFADTASLTRARFHLKGQNSSAWAEMIKRIQTGEIDNDRAEEYLEEIKTATAVTASFSTQCPNCYAAVEPPPRGATSTNCGFCGTVIVPELN
jgi:hypothetical protein